MIGPVRAFCNDCPHRFNCVMFYSTGEPGEFKSASMPLAEIRLHGKAGKPVKCAKEIAPTLINPKNWEWVEEFKPYIEGIKK